MDKILETYKGIIVGVRKNAIKTYSMTLIVITLIVCFSFVTIKLFEKSRTNTQILEYDGYVRSAVAINPDSAVVIRCKAFTDDFSSHFFAFNSLNFKKNLEYSLELGDNSIKNTYLAFRSKNWYNDVIQNNLDQSIRITSLDIQRKGPDFLVDCKAILTIQDINGTGNAIGYVLFYSFLAKQVRPEYPRFKQGFFIEGFTYDIKQL
jgi:hypothetical protein